MTRTAIYGRGMKVEAEDDRESFSGRRLCVARFRLQGTSQTQSLLDELDVDDLVVSMPNAP